MINLQNENIKEYMNNIKKDFHTTETQFFYGEIKDFNKKMDYVFKRKININLKSLMKRRNYEYVTHSYILKNVKNKKVLFCNWFFLGKTGKIDITLCFEETYEFLDINIKDKIYSVENKIELSHKITRTFNKVLNSFEGV